MAEHDASQHNLFSHRQMVAGMLELCVDEDWVRELDLSSLRPVPAKHASDSLRKRRGDMAWRVQHPLGPICLLLEFQSGVSRSMGIRFLTYAGLLWQRLWRRKVRPMPPVFPLVLYNGEERWTAPLEAGELLGPAPAGLKRYQVRMRYFLVDMQRLPEGRLRGRKNAFACLARLERSRSLKEVERVVTDFLEWFPGDRHQALRRDLATWLLHVLLPSRFPGLSVPAAVEDLAEMKSLLAERVKKWPKQWMEEGRQKGLREGRQRGLQEGRQEGQARLLLILLEQKFGTVPRRRRQEIRSAEADVLLKWTRRVLKAERLEHVFNGHLSL